jgi:hypothetical protein
MALFSTLAYSSSEELTRDVGLLDLIPGCVLDSKIFEPCGYSLNAIVKVYFVVGIDLKVILYIVLLWAEVCYITIIRLVTATFSPVSGSHTQTVWLIDPNGKDSKTLLRADLYKSSVTGMGERESISFPVRKSPYYIMQKTDQEKKLMPTDFLIYCTPHYNYV